MRIHVVHVRYRHAGGEDVVVRHEAELLRGAGHDVTVHEFENPLGARALGRLARATWDEAGAAALHAAIAPLQPDVVHVHNTWFAQSPAVFPVLASTGARVVMTLHNYRLLCADGSLFRSGQVCRDCVGHGPWRAVTHRCYRGSATTSAFAAATIARARHHHAYDAVHRFVAPTALVRDLHVAGGLDPGRIVVKPHFVVDRGPRDRAPSASDDVLFVGRLAPGKGARRAIEAWRDAAPSLTLHVLGDGPERAELAELAQPLGARVRFHGHVDAAEVARRMRRARALVFASDWLEPFGLVLIEALAASLPVVGSDIGATPEIVGDGGVLAPPDRLAATLGMLTDGARLDAAGTAGRRRYEHEYTPAAQLPRLEALYRD